MVWVTGKLGHDRGFVPPDKRHRREGGSYFPGNNTHPHQHHPELARTEILRLAARDLRSAGEQIEERATDIWPVGFHRLDDAQCALQLVRESLAAVEQIGWPDADDGAAHPGGG